MKILLDLFCGAGGCAMGYYRAGFTPANGWLIVGVDHAPQPRYPFRFVQGDALAFARRWVTVADFVHASPPCQANSATRNFFVNDPSYAERHIDLINETREAIAGWGVPYAIENVPGAKRLRPNLVLNGYMFPELLVCRPRLFEMNFDVDVPVSIRPDMGAIPTSGRGCNELGFICVTGNGGTAGTLPDGVTYYDHASRAMGIDWMSRAELSQAIPPQYTHWIGGQWRRLNNWGYSLPQTKGMKQIHLFSGMMHPERKTIHAKVKATHHLGRDEYQGRGGEINPSPNVDGGVSTAG